MNQIEPRQIRCKPYHRPRRASDAGRVRDQLFRKSRCPAWASSAELQQRLLDEALIDPDGGIDSLGHPRRLWNAVDGCFFVGVSTNEQQAAYNCYPEIPATSLRSELLVRSERTIEDVLQGGDS
jgi:hypothetical protein